MKLKGVIFFLPIFLFGQAFSAPVNHDRLKHYFTSFASVDNTKLDDRAFLEFVGKLEKKRQIFKNDLDFLYLVFNRTHQKLLRNYKEEATFSELITKGNYNCLSATALYALMFDQLGFDYKMIETEYHIYMLVTADNKEILIETTDPLYGFVTDENEIIRKVNSYRTVNNTKAERSFYQYEGIVNNSINIQQLIGLLHFNLAVREHNRKNMPGAIEALERSCKFYKSSRTEEFARVLLYTLNLQESSPESNAALQKRIENLLRNKNNFVASLQ